MSFVQASVSDVDLEGREVSLIGTVADDIDGFVISDNEDESEMFGFCAVKKSSFFFVQDGSWKNKSDGESLAGYLVI